MAPSGSGLLDRSSGQSMSVAVLKRMDPDVDETLCTASHVALYVFDVASHAWQRKNVEGTLFLVKRRTMPRFKFIVMNGKSTDNFTQVVDGEMTVEQMDNFILYTRKPRGLTGIWFYELSDRERFSHELGRVMASLPKLPRQEEPARDRPAVAPVAGPREGIDDRFFDRSAGRATEQHGSGPAQKHLLDLLINGGSGEGRRAPDASALQDAFAAGRARVGEAPSGLPNGGAGLQPRGSVASTATSLSSVPLLPPSTFGKPSQREQQFENGARDAGAASPGHLQMQAGSIGGMAEKQGRLGGGAVPPLPLGQAGQGMAGGMHQLGSVGSRGEGNGCGEASAQGGPGLERFFGGGKRAGEAAQQGGEDRVRERFRAAMRVLLERNDFVDAMVAEFRAQGLLS